MRAAARSEQGPDQRACIRPRIWISPPDLARSEMRGCWLRAGDAGYSTEKLFLALLGLCFSVRCALGGDDGARG